MSKSNKIWVPGRSVLRGYVASERKVIEGETSKGPYRLVKFRLNEYADRPIPYTPVVAPAARGEWAEQNLVEGDYVEVSGKMSQFNKEDEQTGELKQRFELNANFIRMLSEAPPPEPKPFNGPKVRPSKQAQSLEDTLGAKATQDTSEQSLADECYNSGEGESFDEPA
jgi:hypothetical protein